MCGLSLLKLVDSTTHGEDEEKRRQPPLESMMYKLNNRPSPPPLDLHPLDCGLVDVLS